MPRASDVTTCDRCDAHIIWTITAARRQRMAVDAEPAADGNTAVYTDDLGRNRSRALADGRTTLEHAEWRAKPHAATCTNPPPRRTQRLTPGPVRRRPWRPQ